MPSLIAAIMAALLLTLILYMIVKTITVKLGQSKTIARVIAFLISAVLCYGLGAIKAGPFLPLMFVGAAVFWFVVDTLKELSAA